ncbi:MAG: DUF3489 domain-containing protein [Bryobacteraceae bacterium]
MLFHLTTENHIRTSNEGGPTDRDAGGSTFASEQELQELAGAWPMKRLVEIWNRLPGVEPVARFTDRKTAMARIWRALQPHTEEPGKARPNSKSRHRPVFREGSKAAQVCTLLGRPEGATLNEIRSETGWQAHTVRGFISRNVSKQGRKVRSFEREGERVYRLKV